MILRIQCPNPRCGKVLKIQSGAGGKRVKCPACQQTFKAPVVPEAAEAAQKNCPGCGSRVSAGDVLCLACGMNLETGEMPGGPAVAASAGLPAWLSAPRDLLAALWNIPFLRLGLGLMVVVALALVIFGGWFRRASYVNDMERQLAGSLDERALMSLRETVVRLAAKHSLTVAGEEGHDWGFEIKPARTGLTDPPTGFRAVAVRFEVPVRRRFLGVLPLGTKKVLVSQHTSVPDFYIWPACEGARVVWRALDAACFELTNAEAKLSMAGMRMTVQAGTLPEGTRVTVRFPYTPRTETGGLGTLAQRHRFKLETSPQAPFAKPAVVEFVTAGGAAQAARRIEALERGFAAAGIRMRLEGAETLIPVKVDVTCDRGRGDEKETIRPGFASRVRGRGKAPPVVEVALPVAGDGLYTVSYEVPELEVKLGASGSGGGK